MKKIAYVILLAFFHYSSATAQEQVIHEEVIYKSIDGHDLKAHVFYTETTQQNRKNPALALFHGGGWVFGDPEEFFTTCERYARKGFVAISFQYRLSIKEDGGYPHPDITLVECVKDARSAIRWMRENAITLKIDPDKIAVGGQSAGGQLALSTALLDTINEETDNLKISTMPTVLLLYSSNVNTIEAWIDNIMGDRREEIWSVSPYHNLRSNMPPAIGFMGEEDCMVLPYTVNMFRVKMEKLGNDYELITFPGRGHYLAEGNENFATYFDEDILKQTDEFLAKHGFF